MNDFEFTLFDTKGLWESNPSLAKKPRFVVFETHNRVRPQSFTSLRIARSWLARQGFVLGRAGTWVMPTSE